tara:strand:+ start:101 stop:607 length:507 start_codon:yes stop_codon:yes gene_type:complete
MPCTKCEEEGKYKWGKTGECEYATKEDCESANHKYNKMKPTPLGKKSYAEYEKELKEYNLSKVEKVELALVDDLKEGDKFYKVALDMAMSVNDEIENLSSMMNAVKAAASTAEDKYKVLTKIEKQAKELGVNTNDIAGYTRSANNENYVINIQKSIGKALGSIKGAKL